MQKTNLTHSYPDLITLFDSCFYQQYNTRLVRGDDEPLYSPANADRPYHAIYFAHGFYRSALHECSHWFLAGDARRKLEDFGYWYAPDGRNAAQQTLFEKVEVKPQAIEWILSVAAGHYFCVSVDNLDGEATDPQPFKNAVYEQVKIYAAEGLPERAEVFRAALCGFYGTANRIDMDLFDIAKI
ncbi:MAG: elongation factor P hydroxylase [Gammaproteobacteria bacterium]